MISITYSNMTVHWQLGVFICPLPNPSLMVIDGLERGFVRRFIPEISRNFGLPIHIKDEEQMQIILNAINNMEWIQDYKDNVQHQSYIKRTRTRIRNRERSKI